MRPRNFTEWGTKMPDLVKYNDIYDAQRTIAGRVHRTPTISSSYFGKRLGGRLHFKLESFQKTGSFKVRGVLKKLESLDPAQRAKGAVTISSGNTAQALAYAASVAGIPSVVVMMTGSDPGKVEATRNYGAEVISAEPKVLFDTGQRVQQKRGLAYVPPFDDPKVIAGAGTVGLEVMEDVPNADLVVAGIGGGGLISGVAVAVKGHRPKARVVGVEPVGACAMTKSLKDGKTVRLDRVDTVTDGLRGTLRRRAHPRPRPEVG
ncbi:MAG: pyridoxal-phosphate dependent enzyme [SAR202 cluster bacterium]|nr:pyridoxal-phosphate dependent enzyme [SAR202 cluster bacterium]